MKSLARWAAISLMALAGAATAAEKTVAWTGWFSDLQCASSHVASGLIEGNNPECARTCIEKGTPPAFISEQAKAVFTVKDYPSVIEELGYHVAVEARIDEAAKTIVIQKVTRLEYEGASCGRTRKAK